MDTKWIGRSQTTAGLLLAMLPYLVQLVGLDVTAEEITGFSEGVMKLIEVGFMLVGYVVAILGRNKAAVTGTIVTFLPKL